MKLTIGSAEKLSELIPGLNLPCGGRGTCGRCRVRLLSGVWAVDGAEIHAPASALACRTRLLGKSGEVEFHGPPATGQIVTEWRGSSLPVTADPVIGIDIGTTTVAAVKIQGGKIIGTASCFNAQGRFGDNVITRISRCMTGRLEELRLAVMESITELLRELEAADVARMAVSANTVMSCILHGIDPSPIGALPFAPPRRTFPVLHWPMPVYTMPAISGYVGGDITAALDEVRLQEGEMLVDIGTNCEIACRTADEIICTAAAAGPAFEGAGVNCGCRATPGAIEHWRGDGEFDVIGGGSPGGLCGSGMVDFLAVERRNGRLNEFGRLQPAAEAAAVAPGLNIHEWEIEQLLKAKAAVYAGIKTLSSYCAMPIRRIYLAGAFARHLNLANAVAIRMLPETEYVTVGNTSLGGAVRLAADPSKLSELEQLSNEPREIILNTLADFEDNYIDGLLLP